MSTQLATTLARGHDALGAHVTLTVNAVSHRFRWVPPGTFTMGNPRPRRRTSWDETAHPVTLTAGAWLGEAPVTRAFWAAVEGETGDGVDATLPVVNVSWDDCEAFLARLTKTAPGLSPCLPSEALWERACRAGTDAETWLGRATVAALDPHAWSVENSEHRAQPVAAKAPNPWGFHDMLGNVWEWCDDWYGRYPAAPAVDPTGPGSGLQRIARGGMFLNAARLLTAPRRVAFSTDYRDVAVGVRLAHPVGAPPWDAPSPQEASGAPRRAARTR